jgi:hypothetical protein
MSLPKTAAASLPVLVAVVAAVASPLLWNNQEHWIGAGCLLVLMIVTVMSCLLCYYCAQQPPLTPTEKFQIRWNVMEPGDIVQGLASAYETTTGLPQQPHNDDESDRVLWLTTGLAALATKYEAQRQRHKGADATATNTNNTASRLDAMALVCQEAAYIGLRCCHSNANDADLALPAASLALLALVAKNAFVRVRHCDDAGYGLALPVAVLRRVLQVAQSIDNENEDREQEAAEVVRKGCLLLGALAEGAPAVAQRVVAQGGMDVILEAARWYRHHAEVANWSLWALFSVCYEAPAHKATFVAGDGIALTLDLLRHCGTDSLAVTRHGVALLFDLLRAPDDAASQARVLLDVGTLRRTALAAGLHDVLVLVLGYWTHAMDVMMMGSELLVGTGYEGDIPIYAPPEIKRMERD